MNPYMQPLTVKQLIGIILLHQKCQKATGPKHRNYDRHGEAIREACAEMAARVKAGDPEAMAAKL